jgi:PIN domain nuclease of toxin-antitoxin system
MSSRTRAGPRHWRGCTSHAVWQPGRRYRTAATGARRAKEPWEYARNDYRTGRHHGSIERTCGLGSSPLNLLLDTHIWLWSSYAPERLSDNVRAAIASESNDLWLSPVSVWEYLLLAERGRLQPAGLTPADWATSALSSMPLRDAPLSREVAIRSRMVGLPREDPADRFIVATATVYDLTLVTSDANLLAGSGFATLENG